MPFCPKCRDEFQDWVELCPDCHVPLVDRLQPTGGSTPASDRDRLVTIASFFHPEEAHLFSARLQAEGIRSAVIGDTVSGLYYFSPTITSGVGVQVFESDAAKARRILGLIEPKSHTLHSHVGRCPKCKSEDIHGVYSAREILLWCVLTVGGAHLPFLKRKWKCKSCGYQWRD